MVFDDTCRDHVCFGVIHDCEDSTSRFAVNRYTSQVVAPGSVEDIEIAQSNLHGDMMDLFAYLDPGTGTVIVQAILGGTAGVVVLFKTMGSRFSRKNKSDNTAADAEATDADDQNVPSSNTD